MRGPISFSPEPDPREEAKRFAPWWRRLGAWLADFQKFVMVLVGISGTTIAIHVWLKGLITRAELDLAVQTAVEKAVTKAMLDVRSDVTDLKTATGGLGPFRASTSDRLANVEAKANVNSDQVTKLGDRFDRYLARGGR